MSDKTILHSLVVLCFHLWIGLDINLSYMITKNALKNCILSNQIPTKFSFLLVQFFTEKS